MDWFESKPKREIPGPKGPSIVRCVADVDRILEGLCKASGDRSSEQFREELDIALDARLYFMKRG